MKENEVKIGERVKIKTSPVWESEYDNQIAVVRKQRDGRSSIFSIVLEGSGEETEIHCEYLTKFINSGGSKKIMWEWLG